MEIENETPKTDEQALQLLRDHTRGNFYLIAIAQFKLSRQRKKSLTDSIKDAMAKVTEVSTRVLQDYEPPARTPLEKLKFLIKKGWHIN